MLKKIFLSLLLIGLSISIKAQTTTTGSYDPVNAKYGHGADSIKCMENLMIMSNSQKSGDLKQALESWKILFNNFPAASKNIYIYGSKILKGLSLKETDQSKVKEYMNLIAELHKKRGQYFKEYTESNVMINTASDYLEMTNNNEVEMSYKILKEVAGKYKENIDPINGLSAFMYASFLKLKKDPSHKEQYLKDYFETSDDIEKAMDNARTANDNKRMESLEQVQNGIINGFIDSGVGDCKTLTDYFAKKLDANKNNKQFLTEVVSSLTAVKCTESDVYGKASELLHKISPSPKSAIGLASRAVAKKDFDTAIKYYTEAANMEKDKKKSAEYLYSLSVALFNKKAFAKSREAANKALSYNPQMGKAYILIANLYAATSGEAFSNEPQKRGLVFCAAVDKLIKAKSVDSSLSDETNKLISQYSQYYIDKSTAFMMGIKSGQSITIPGWIGEKTTVRFK